MNNKMQLTTYIGGKTENEAKQGLLIKDKKKITVITNKKTVNGKEKRYYSYQFNIPLNTMNLVYKDKLKGDKNKLIYLIQKNKQRFYFEFAEQEPENAIKTFFKVDMKKRYITYTLPKKFIKYLQAYDDYLDVLNEINNEIKEQNKVIENGDDKIKQYKKQPLYVDIDIFVLPKDDGKDLDYDMTFKIHTELDDRFINYAKNETLKYGGLPGWMQTLCNDWETQDFLKALDIPDNINKWKY